MDHLGKCIDLCTIISSKNFKSNSTMQGAKTVAFNHRLRGVTIILQIVYEAKYS
jgi:hypothetical protein